MRIWLLLITMIATKSSSQELFVFTDLALIAGPAPLRPGCADIARWTEFAPLSPAIPQGGRMLFVLAVVESAGKPFVVQTGQNPANSLVLRMHRIFPDIDSSDDPVEVPIEFRGRVAESQRCAIFLVDVEVPRSTPPGRLKLEPALWVPDSATKDFWIRYPMEIRITAASDRPVPSCQPGDSAIRRLVERSFSAWLTECTGSATLPVMATKVRDLRRQEGKNQ